MFYETQNNNEEGRIINIALNVFKMNTIKM